MLMSQKKSWRWQIMAKRTENKGALGMFETIGKVSMPQKQITTEQTITSEINDTSEKKSIEKDNKRTESEKKSTTKVPKNVKEKKEEKHAGGRPNKRGEKGRDFQMINVAVPVEIYEKLKAASEEKTAGNMTYYINSILKESTEK